MFFNKKIIYLIKEKMKNRQIEKVFIIKRLFNKEIFYKKKNKIFILNNY
jgi:hypothetical protein